MKTILAFAMILVVLLSAPSMWAQCGNRNPGGPGGPTPPVGPNGPTPNTGDPVNVYTGNEYQEITDLSVWGGIGGHALEWKRWGNSRSIGGNKPFGQGHFWRHGYQWELSTGGSDSQARALVNVIYPNGSQFTFTQLNPILWRSTGSCPDFIFSEGDNLILQQKDGMRFHFTRYLANAKPYYLMTSFEDVTGLVYPVEYNSQRQMTRVCEPGGRFLLVSYKTASLTQTDFRDFSGSSHVISPADNVPSNPHEGGAEVGKSDGGGGGLLPLVDGPTKPVVTVDPQYYGWTELKITNPVDCSSVRLVGADGTNVAVAEVEFYQAVPALLTGLGKPLGSSPYQYVKITGGLISSDPVIEAQKAVDGSRNTVFVSSSVSGGYVGYVFGTKVKIGMVRYLAQTVTGLAGHDNNAWGRSPVRLQYANNGVPSSLSIINRVESSDGRAVDYAYTDYVDNSVGSRWPTLTSAIYGDGTAAHYRYGQIFPGQIPMVVEYDNPRYGRAMPRSKTIYQNLRSNSVLGMVDQQVNVDTGGSLLKISVYNGNLHQPTAAFSNGAVTRYAINNGIISDEYDGLGRRSSYTYDANGFNATAKDPLGRITRFEQDNYGHLLRKTAPDGSVEQWTRDDRGLELTYTDALGRVTTTTRDNRHRAIQLDYPDGSFESLTYNEQSQILTHQQRQGGTESFVYDARGLLVQKTDAVGAQTTYGYDASDRLASVTDARGNTTQMAYNERGLLVAMTNPDGSVRRKGYDTYGNPASETNELGQTWSYTYDQFRRLAQVTDPLGRSTVTTYPLNDLENKPLRVTLPSGRQTGFSYDLVWNTLQQTIGVGSADAATTRWSYSATDQPLTLTDALGHLTRMGYDVRDRKVTETNALNQTTSWSYDAANNMILLKRPDNTVSTSGYDVMNRLVQSRDALGQTTVMSYDSGGNLAAMTDAKGNTYRYEHDLLNRVTGLTWPDSSAENYAYDAVGNRIGYRTRAGVLQSSAYDIRNREVAAQWADGTPGWQKSYDLIGRLVSVTSTNGIMENYQYDNANQMSSESTVLPAAGGQAGVMNYTYNADGLRQSVTYSDGTIVSSEYNGRNQASSVIRGDQEVARYGYDSAGNRITKALANGTVSRYAYDAANRLTQIRHRKDNVVLDQVDYTLNSLGNRTGRTANGQAERYSYDAIQQVTGVNYADARTVNYNYDAVGNRQKVSVSGPANHAVTAPGAGDYAVNSVNQYTSLNGASLSYDGNGNLLTAPGAVFTFNAYDSKNRLTSATRGLDKIEFTYDAANRCVERAYYHQGTLTQKTGLIYDGWNLVQEIDLVNGNTVQATYVHGAGTDELLCRTDGSGTIYYHQDGLGSTTSLSDEAGQILERYTYDIFGQARILALTGLILPVSAFRNRFLFTGREYLSEVNLYDYRNRMYSSELGRFLQTDPILFQAGDINIYRYCGNGPSVYTDPNGKYIYLVFGALALAATGYELYNFQKDVMQSADNALQANKNMINGTGSQAQAMDAARQYNDTVVNDTYNFALNHLADPIFPPSDSGIESALGKAEDILGGLKDASSITDAILNAFKSLSLPDNKIVDENHKGCDFSF